MVKDNLIRKTNNISIVLLFVPIVIGLVSSIVSRDMDGIYKDLYKPYLSPPSYVFPVVWSALYALMGIGMYLIYMNTIHDDDRTYAIICGLIQLFLNFMWSIIFVNYDNYLMSFIWIVILIFIVLLMLYYYRRVNTLAYYLNLPYLLWLAYAAYLNFFIFMFN